MERSTLNFISVKQLHCTQFLGHTLFPNKGFLTRSPNKILVIQLQEYIFKHFVQCSYEPFTWVRSLKIRRGWFIENTSPLCENAKVEQYGSPIKSNKVSYKPFTWVRSLKIGRGWFVENISPMSENTKVEQYGSPLKSSFSLRGEDEVSYGPFPWVRSLKIGRGWFVENTSPLSENAKVEQYGSPVKSSLTLKGKDEVSYEPFTWIISLKIGIGWFTKNASLLAENLRPNSIVRQLNPLLPSWSKVDVRKETSPLFVSQG